LLELAAARDAAAAATAVIQRLRAEKTAANATEIELHKGALRLFA
jgi:hypothetical protein